MQVNIRLWWCCRVDRWQHPLWLKLRYPDRRFRWRGKFADRAWDKHRIRWWAQEKRKTVTFGEENSLEWEEEEGISFFEGTRRERTSYEDGQVKIR